MPNYKAHLGGGLVTYAVVSLALLTSTHPTPATALGWLFFCLVGSIFPDIDVKSKMQKWYFSTFFILLILLIINNQFKCASFLALMSCTPLIVNHRGIFHRAWFIISLGIGLITLCRIYTPTFSCVVDYNVLFFVTGCLTHLWLDMGFRKMLKIG